MDIYPSNEDLSTDGDYLFFSISTGAAPTAVKHIENGNVLAMFYVYLNGAATSTLIMPYRINLQDKNGFGQLVATDRININAMSHGMAAAVQYHWRIYYRYVTVGAEEYIGIVQSQMGTS